LRRDATPEEIKKSFRRLAHAFHPDKNADNSFASAYFRDIREAYEVLSRPVARHAYDLERSRMGMNNRELPEVSTGFLCREAQKLNRHLDHAGAHRIDEGLLFASLIYLLSEQHLALLLQPDAMDDRIVFMEAVKKAMQYLPYDMLLPLKTPLLELAAKDEISSEAIRLFFEKRRKAYRWQKTFPWLAILITLLLCALMFWYGKR